MKYGTNSFFKTLLQSGPTPFNVKKLGAELKALAPVSPAISIEHKHASKSIKPIDHAIEQPIKESQQTDINVGLSEQAPPKNTADFPKYLELKELLKTTYRQLERNMAELDISTNESYLHQVAKNILSLYQKTRDIYKLLDYYDEHECFPEVKHEVIRTPAQEIQLLRQSTSKAKARLSSGTCRDIEATKQLIEANNKRIIELGGKVKHE